MILEGNFIDLRVIDNVNLFGWRKKVLLLLIIIFLFIICLSWVVIVLWGLFILI